MQCQAHQDLEVEAQLGEQVPLNVAQLLQEAVALLRRAEHKHLHLGELVQAVQPLAGSPCHRQHSLELQTTLLMGVVWCRQS